MNLLEEEVERGDRTAGSGGLVEVTVNFLPAAWRSVRAESDITGETLTNIINRRLITRAPVVTSSGVFAWWIALICAGAGLLVGLGVGMWPR